ncbi:hypothetical protein [Streptacidiphilus melanogenes]|uniref:hypothetical protein n=1 Tax=Streptacidiphilus melanogenes TaxID=411235 RepID=UPI0005AB7935|nr:hypothetical protein [Streptacidiphilus melanogenes]
MLQQEWFSVDDTEVDDTQKAFLEVVRERARHWPECPPSHAITLVYNEEEDLDEDGNAELLLVVDVSDLPHKRVLLTLGASLVGDTLSCGEVHNQTYQFEEREDRAVAVRASGGPEELGRIAASWFEEILRRPVIRSDSQGSWSFLDPSGSLPSGYSLARRGGL